MTAPTSAACAASRKGRGTLIGRNIHVYTTHRDMPLVRFRNWLLTLVAMLLLPGISCPASNSVEPLDFYLMDFIATGHRLAESIPVYRSDDAWLVHFSSFLKAVEFPIEQEGTVWTGWFHQEESRFTWDPGSEKAPFASSPVSFINVEEGVFVSLTTLESWFDLEFTAMPRTQVISLSSSELLPFQRRKARESAKKRYKSRAAEEADVRVPDQYAWATMPLIDLSSHYRIRSGDGERRSDVQAAMTMSMDLAKHSLMYSGSTASDSRHRLTISRTASTIGGTLVPGIDTYQLGDVFDSKSSLVNGGGLGTGFSIGRRRSATSGSQGRTAITGDGPPGWEAELYLNNSLVAFATVTDEGFYAFPEQEIVYGENVFVVQLFGPQGQVREQHQSFWGGGIDLEPGEGGFTVNHIDFTRRLIGGHLDAPSLPAENTTGFHYARGLTSDLQMGLGYTRASVASSTSGSGWADGDYVTLDGKMNVGKGLLLTELVAQQARGRAWSLQYLTGLGGNHIGMAHRTFRDFESPYTVRRIEADAESQITLSGPLALAGLNSYALRFSHRNRADGHSDQRVFGRLGARVGPTYVTNELDYLRISNGEEFFSGKLHISGRWKRINLRGRIDYNLSEADPLSQISANLRWNYDRDTNWSLGAFKNLQNDKLFYLHGTFTTRLRDYDLSVSFDTGAGDAWSMGIALRTGFGYPDDSARLTHFAAPRARMGRVLLNLFLDENNNGVRDSGESALVSASYKNHRSTRTSPGVIELAGVPAHVPLRLQRQDFRFNDPFLLLREEIYEIYTHPGSRLRADIPVVMTGDVEGQLQALPGTGARVSNLTVVLYNNSGEPVAEVQSEFDGYYSFRNLAAGDYAIAFSPSSTTMHRQFFSLDGKKGFVALSPMFVN